MKYDQTIIFSFVVWNFYEKTVDKFFVASMISYFVSETKWSDLLNCNHFLESKSTIINLNV